MENYDVDPKILEDAEWRELLASIEYLDPQHQEAMAGYTSQAKVPESLEIPLERALAYFIYRHCTAAYDADAFCEALGFALFCERLMASMAMQQPEMDIMDIARVVSEELEYCEENKDAIMMEFAF